METGDDVSSLRFECAQAFESFCVTQGALLSSLEDLARTLRQLQEESLFPGRRAGVGAGAGTAGGSAFASPTAGPSWWRTRRARLARESRKAKTVGEGGIDEGAWEARRRPSKEGARSDPLADPLSVRSTRSVVDGARARSAAPLSTTSGAPSLARASTSTSTSGALSSSSPVSPATPVAQFDLPRALLDASSAEEGARRSRSSDRPSGEATAGGAPVGATAGVPAGTTAEPSTAGASSGPFPETSDALTRALAACPEAAAGLATVSVPRPSDASPSLPSPFGSAVAPPPVRPALADADSADPLGRALEAARLLRNALAREADDLGLLARRLEEMALREAADGERAEATQSVEEAARLNASHAPEGALESDKGAAFSAQQASGKSATVSAQQASGKSATISTPAPFDLSASQALVASSTASPPPLPSLPPSSSRAASSSASSAASSSAAVALLVHRAACDELRVSAEACDQLATPQADPDVLEGVCQALKLRPYTSTAVESVMRAWKREGTQEQPEQSEKAAPRRRPGGRRAVGAKA